MRWLPKLVPSNLARAEIIPVALDFGPVTVKGSRGRGEPARSALDLGPVTVKVSRALSPTAARRKACFAGEARHPAGTSSPTVPATRARDETTSTATMRLAPGAKSSTGVEKPRETGGITSSP